MDKVITILLAAGEGVRMRSDIPKPLHTICGRTLLDWALLSVPASKEKPIAVTGFGAEQIIKGYGDKLRFVRQVKAGTGGALLSAKEYITKGRVLVMACDLPMLRPETLSALTLISSSAAFLSATMESPMGYGRVLREVSRVAGIIDAADVTAITRHIRETRVSAYCFNAELLNKALDELKQRDGGFSMSEVIGWFIANGEHVDALPVCAEEAMGVNDRVQLSECAALMRNRINRRHMLQGVTFIDPSAAYIDDTVKLGRDCTIYPGVIIEGDTRVGAGTILYPSCRLKNSVIGDNCALQGVVANEAHIGDNVTAGPYVHLRPQARIGNNCRIGNYIEVKNSNVGDGTKLPHLSYVGDSDVGERVNMGCGCVTVNYDGVKKHRTVIGDDAFIGCNTSLIAPVNVGDGAYTAAGSAITSDVPADALAVARGRQVNKKGYAQKLRKIKREPQ